MLGFRSRDWLLALRAASLPLAILLLGCSDKGCLGATTACLDVAPLSGDSALTFGSVPLGMTGTAILHMHNAASSGVAFTAPFVLDGGAAADFSAADGGCPELLGPGESCSETMTFAPNACGPRSATATVGGGSFALTVALDGVGSCPDGG